MIRKTLIIGVGNMLRGDNGTVGDGCVMSENELRWQDEILQMMYWMRGENLGDVTPEQLCRFLYLTQPAVDTALQRLRAHGLIHVQTDGRGITSWQLTERGIAEGKRRFLDEFSPYLGKESHIECGDPDCNCHAPDWDGVCHSPEAP